MAAIELSVTRKKVTFVHFISDRVKRLTTCLVASEAFVTAVYYLKKIRTLAWLQNYNSGKNNLGPVQNRIKRTRKLAARIRLVSVVFKLGAHLTTTLQNKNHLVSRSGPFLSSR